MEDNKYATKCIAKLETLLEGSDPEMLKDFQIITDKRILKKVAADEFVKAYPRAANRSGRFAANGK